MNIHGTFDYPKEKHDILQAYYKLAPWAQSGGAQFPDWYQDMPGYRNAGELFQH
jgi:LruC domain-containing protein